MKVSVITVNFNNREGLDATLRSTFGQLRFSDFETIVIDGGSDDGSLDVIKSYASRLSYWVSEPDNGIYDGMNKGIDAAKGDYVIFMNSGDCFFDNLVLWKVFGKARLTADVVCGDFFYDGLLRRMPQVVTATFMFGDALCHQAVFLKTSMLKANHYDECYKITADWVQMFDAIVLCNATYQHVGVTICTLQNGGLSRIHWRRLAEERVQHLKKVLPPRIYADYKAFKQERHAGQQGRLFMELLTQIGVNSRPARWVYFFMRAIIRLRTAKQKIWHGK